MKNRAQLLEDSLLVIWNDRNSQNRLQAMQRIYASDIQFFETDGDEPFVGHDAINDVIGKLQSEWPVEFSFQLTEPAKANNEIQLISWTLGIPGQTPVAKGSDVAIIENGKIKSLHLFLG
ncbi:nuclear transport factor 2 family protein [Flavobacterium sp. MAH-1]|uniref:Nuclear transport factor 2 family protein n=1 Tax=Flavobacterium agri TaxID=2743471 RepID=A0A7Y8Y0K3_9FLAO|nr:nuclear transport factor 2 family protein [Flavobacterium agri]NUY80288.1 nuclear transport factor 2 family protein [Flavobacterium agri]NYA70313.1 nuclear transport factor 2 family protein [Flavobacterium agri]